VVREEGGGGGGGGGRLVYWKIYNKPAARHEAAVFCCFSLNPGRFAVVPLAVSTAGGTQCPVTLCGINNNNYNNNNIY